MEQSIVWYSAGIIIIGLIAFLVVVNLGRFMADKNIINVSSSQNELLDKIMNHYKDIGFRSNFIRHFVNANSEYLQRRNEFFATYLQVIVAILIVIILAILLITKTITAEAGPPILSAVSGFAIAKTVSGGRADSQDGNDRQ